MISPQKESLSSRFLQEDLLIWKDFLSIYLRYFINNRHSKFSYCCDNSSGWWHSKKCSEGFGQSPMLHPNSCDGWCWVSLEKPTSGSWSVQMVKRLPMQLWKHFKVQWQKLDFLSPTGSESIVSFDYSPETVTLWVRTIPSLTLQINCCPK